MIASLRSLVVCMEDAGLSANIGRLLAEWLYDLQDANQRQTLLLLS